eukprot:scaffold4188_cov73-Phaeocystis_antarctica.AAC.3
MRQAEVLAHHSDASEGPGSVDGVSVGRRHCLGPEHSSACHILRDGEFDAHPGVADEAVVNSRTKNFSSLAEHSTSGALPLPASGGCEAVGGREQRGEERRGVHHIGFYESGLVFTALAFCYPSRRDLQQVGESRLLLNGELALYAFTRLSIPTPQFATHESCPARRAGTVQPMRAAALLCFVGAAASPWPPAPPRSPPSTCGCSDELVAMAALHASQLEAVVVLHAAELKSVRVEFRNEFEGLRLF